MGDLASAIMPVCDSGASCILACPVRSSFFCGEVLVFSFELHVPVELLDVSGLGSSKLNVKLLGMISILELRARSSYASRRVIDASCEQMVGKPRVLIMQHMHEPLASLISLIMSSRLTLLCIASPKFSHS